MEKYQVTGMSCAACSARVEKAVSGVKGVTYCSVNLLTNSMFVEGTSSPHAIIKAVEKAGYSATISDSKSTYRDYGESLEDKVTPVLRRRLFLSLIFLVLLMYCSMGHMMWGWPLPRVLIENHMALGILQMLLTIVVMIINRAFFINGLKSMLGRSPNMDTLVALGSGAAFIYSVYVLFVRHNIHDLYFESAAMILTLITVGKTLEAYSKGKTTDALKGLMKLAPKTANVIREGKEIELAIEDVKIDDIFTVRPGESVPVDGVIIEGESAINESAITGESIPVDKTAGDEVTGATINQSGFLKCRATRIGEDTTISQIIKMVSDASATKAPIAKIADKVSGIFVPVVIVLALITSFVWFVLGKEVGYALARGISVLVISCPCALGLATPVAIMVGNGVAAKNGIMFKTATALENMGKSHIVLLDKTGTITKGEPKVTDIITCEGVSENTLLRYAGALEKLSEHPLAKAVMSYADMVNTIYPEVTEFIILPGHGLRAVCEQDIIQGGNYEYIEKNTDIPDYIIEKTNLLALEGKTPMYFSKKSKLLGVIAVSDTVKEESRMAIADMKRLGLHTVMLTGDNERSANAIGRQVGVDEVIAGVKPDEKERVVRRYKKKGNVIMVGDGINDAPALTRADVGVAIGSGTDIAIDCADVVVIKSRLTDVVAAIRLSKATINNIRENLFWAFFYNALGIPLAAGVFIPVLGWELNPMFGAAAMSLSSFCVVSNALRLNFAKIYDASKDKKIKNNRKREDLEMEKTMKIEGMMCGHCEARVKKCLEAIPQVCEAIVSHENGTAVVILSENISDDILKKTIEDQDYTVISIN